MESQWAHNVLITTQVESPLQKQSLASKTTRDEQLDWRLSQVRLAFDRTGVSVGSVRQSSSAALAPKVKL